MKLTFFSVIISFISSAAFACPQINGTYSCDFNGHSEKTVYTTRLENNVYIYQMNLSNGVGEVPADGVMRKYGSDPDVVLSLTCADSNLFITSQMTKVSGDVANFACAGSGVDHIDAESTWEVSENQITQNNKGKLYCRNGNVLNMGGNYTCIKQP
jgi:hypothetical protein